MAQTERLTTLPSSGDVLQRDHEPVIPADAVRRIKDLLLPTSSDVWAAPLRPSNFRLAQSYPVRGGTVIQVEILESNRQPGFPNHARIYLRPTETYIPTIVIGEYSAVAYNAGRDGRPAYPLLPGTHVIDTRPQEIRLDELRQLSGIEDVLQNPSLVMFAVRPSSFLLRDVCLLQFDGITLRAKKYENHFAPGMMFCHITSPNEWDEALPNMIHSLSLSNSEAYTRAHPELGFIQI